MLKTQPATCQMLTVLIVIFGNHKWIQRSLNSTKIFGMIVNDWSYLANVINSSILDIGSICGSVFGRDSFRSKSEVYHTLYNQFEGGGAAPNFRKNSTDYPLEPN